MRQPKADVSADVSERRLCAISGYWAIAAKTDFAAENAVADSFRFQLVVGWPIGRCRSQETVIAQ
jgi:hypothetical protein